MDCVGPLIPSQKVEFNYALVLCDSNTSYPFAFPLHSLSAKNVCNALLQLFQIIGIPSTILSDCGSNFTSSLTTSFLKVLGCTPNFNVPYRPQQSSLCERLIGTLKSMISKVAADQPKMWHKHLGFVLWSIRVTPHSTTGILPSMLVWGRLPRGPLAVLKVKDGKDGIRIATDNRYLNKYCEGDAHPMPDAPDLMIRVWKSRYKSLNKIPWGTKEN